MTGTAEAAIDEDAAHRHLSGRCFDAACTLIDKPDRSAADDEAMVLLNAHRCGTGRNEADSPIATIA